MDAGSMVIERQEPELKVEEEDIAIDIGEATPLLGSGNKKNVQAHQGRDSDGPTFCEKYVAYTFHLLFYLLCSLTGQLTISCPRNCTNWKSAMFQRFVVVWSSVFLLVFLLVNLGSLVFDIYAIAFCPFDRCGYIYSTPHNSSQHLGLGLLPDQLAQYEDWQKTVITTATISGLVSYYFIVILVLIPQYSFLRGACRKLCEWHVELWKKCGDTHIRPSRPRDGDILSLFIDWKLENADKDESTFLNGRQAFYFHFILWFNLAVYAGNVTSLSIILDDLLSSADQKLEAIDITGVAAQLGSQLCAILSCFIFSKVAYAVSNRCLRMIKEFKEVDIRFQELIARYELLPVDDLPGFWTENEKQAHCYLLVLKRKDKKYVDLVKATLDPYSTWFAVHWILYTLSAFMAIAYLAEMIIQELYGKIKSGKCPITHNNPVCTLELTYIAFFALEHFILFLYPCFRAAAVTASRKSLIKMVTEEPWTNIPQNVIDSFVEYQKNQNCGFKITILCTNIQFGFNIAYLSIFFGIFSVVLKLSF